MAKLAGNDADVDALGAELPEQDRIAMFRACAGGRFFEMDEKQSHLAGLLAALGMLDLCRPDDDDVLSNLTAGICPKCNEPLEQTEDGHLRCASCDRCYPRPEEGDAADDADDELVPPDSACPKCNERRMDLLVWTEDEHIRCASCGMVYDPTKRD